MLGVEPQEPLALALKPVFAAFQLELDHIANMAFELANGAHDLALGIPHQAEPPPQQVLGG